MWQTREGGRHKSAASETRWGGGSRGERLPLASLFTSPLGCDWRVSGKKQRLSECVCAGHFPAMLGGSRFVQRVSLHRLHSADKWGFSAYIKHRSGERAGRRTSRYNRGNDAAKHDFDLREGARLIRRLAPYQDRRLSMFGPTLGPHRSGLDETKRFGPGLGQLGPRAGLTEPSGETDCNEDVLRTSGR